MLDDVCSLGNLLSEVLKLSEVDIELGVVEVSCFDWFANFSELFKSREVLLLGGVFSFSIDPVDDDLNVCQELGSEGVLEVLLERTVGLKVVSHLVGVGLKVVFGLLGF